MERPTVVITHWVHREVISLLEKKCTVVPNQTKETLPREEVLRRSVCADGLIAFMTDHIDESFLDACPRLKVIGAALKGYDNFDVDACNRRGIRFSIAPDRLTEPTAELAVGLMIGLDRRILAGDRLVRSGRFRGWRPIMYGKGLAGATVGIVGMGAIGRAVAQRLAGFGCRLIYVDPRGEAAGADGAFNARSVELAELLEVSEYIMLAAPLTNDTIDLINDATLARVRQGAYLINMGRGSVVDEEAVARALGEGRLAGYAADVFVFEDWARPDRSETIDEQLLVMEEQTLFTPHLGSAVDDVRRLITLDAAHEVLSVLDETARLRE